LRQNDWIPGIIWLFLGLGVTFGSLKLKLGSLVSPGPGLMPFILGVVLILCSLLVLSKSLLLILRKNEGQSQSIWVNIDLKKVITVVACLLGYTLILEKVGFLLTTFLILTILFKTVGSQRWISVLIASIFTVLACYFVFILFLKVELPPGIWGRI
jgi:putative tricarboxylic transport membrane protein